MEDHFKNHTKYMIHGQINIGSKIFQLFGSNDIIMPYRTITSIFLSIKHIILQIAYKIYLELALKLKLVIL